MGHGWPWGGRRRIDRDRGRRCFESNFLTRWKIRGEKERTLVVLLSPFYEIPPRVTPITGYNHSPVRSSIRSCSSIFYPDSRHPRGRSCTPFRGTISAYLKSILCWWLCVRACISSPARREQRDWAAWLNTAGNPASMYYGYL